MQAEDGCGLEGAGVGAGCEDHQEREREFFIDNLLVRIHFIIEMIRWTGLAPWEFEFRFHDNLCFLEKDLAIVSSSSCSSLLSLQS